MTFVSTDPQGHAGETNVWLTPRWLLDALGPFDLDPCAHPGWNTAAEHYYERGLELPWKGRIWCNPPYGKHARHWIERLAAHGNGIALVFNRLETSWLQPIIEKQGVFFIKGRLSFLRGDFTEDSNAGTGSVLVPFGRENVGRILASKIEGVWKQ